MTDKDFNSFSLTQLERSRLAKFITKHIGCHTTWIGFNDASGIGVACRLSCACGEKEDITEYESW